MAYRNTLAVTLVLYMFFLVTLSVHAQKEIYLSPIEKAGKGALSIAIAPIAIEGEGSGGAKLAETIREILEYDLEFSDIFACLTNRGFINEADQNDSEAGKIVWQGWQSLGVDLMIKASCERTTGKILLKCRLYDVVVGKQLEGKSYRGNETQIRQLVHLPRPASRHL